MYFIGDFIAGYFRDGRGVAVGRDHGSLLGRVYRLELDHMRVALQIEFAAMEKVDELVGRHSFREKCDVLDLRNGIEPS